MEYILLYSDSNKHLGLFEDLKTIPNVDMFLVGYKKVNNILRQIRRVHVNWRINRYVPLPFRSIWYKKPSICIDSNKDYCVIVMDSVMCALNEKKLNKLFSKPNVRGVFVLINSINAHSVTILESKAKFKKVKWNAIYSFDAKDVIRYGFKPLGNCYYSFHKPEKFICDFPKKKISDAYFIGGLKGEREDLIISVFELLHQNNISTNFNLLMSGVRRFKTKRFADKINYYIGGWIPYEKVLAGVYQANVIVEFLQDGQCGPSLRYYEAICYNKKLLTNNKDIIHYPYYNEKYMKIFHTKEDIDLSWVMNKEKIDYHYAGDFSPKYLLEKVLL